MAIERNCAMLMLKARRDGASFQRSLMLGHQGLGLDDRAYRAFHHACGSRPASTRPAYADDLFPALGADQVDVMDFSGYEGANLLHDLNQPVPAAWHGQFDVVVDGGTLEHVFNIPVALRNVMELLRPGGRFLSATIPNNWCGHGFYQFSPELFFRVFSPENGFRIEGMFMAEIDGSRWWSVRDPAVARSRVELVNDRPVYLLVQAVRDAVVPVLAATPQQSDYVVAWSGDHGPARHAAWKQRLRSLPILRSLDAARRRRQVQRWASFNNSNLYTPFIPPVRL
ncbi:MAG: class I SAM-dependent methyltransferase [Verrucomicrobiota bacterium]|jgi:SAM-dependent methyltransferase